MKTWRGFRRLGGFERGVALEAALALTVTWVGLRLAGFRRWKGFLAWLAPAIARVSPAQNAGRMDSARRIARVEESVARNFFVHSNCLERSLSLWWLLRVRGITSDLRIGARKEEGRFEAHAWVEFGGAVLSGGNEGNSQFVPFDGPLVSMETQSH